MTPVTAVGLANNCAMGPSIILICEKIIYRGSNMSAHVLLNLLNKLSILSFLRNEYNKFNNTGLRSTNARFFLSHDIKIT